jgi:hypothetical protein
VIAISVKTEIADICRKQDKWLDTIVLFTRQKVRCRMQVMINISKDDFEEICMQARMVEDTGSLFGRIRKAIFHGTQIPKGHGRLKDIDKIEWYGCTTAFDCPHKDRECKDCDRAECSKTQVDDIPTIIEADKAESEGKK